MSTIYSKPNSRDLVHQLIEAVANKWHQPLLDAEVTFCVLFAGSTELGESGLKVKGHSVAARIRVVPLMWRAAGNADALIEIDEETWNGLEEDSQAALLDHELSHIGLVEEEDGRLKRDDLGRPKLQTIRGDFMGGDGFVEVIRRHGEAALEVINSRRIHGVVTAAAKEAFEGSAP